MHIVTVEVVDMFALTPSVACHINNVLYASLVLSSLLSSLSISYFFQYNSPERVLHLPAPCLN